MACGPKDRMHVSETRTTKVDRLYIAMQCLLSLYVDIRNATAPNSVTRFCKTQGASWGGQSIKDRQHAMERARAAAAGRTNTVWLEDLSWRPDGLNRTTNESILRIDHPRPGEGMRRIVSPSVRARLYLRCWARVRANGRAHKLTGGQTDRQTERGRNPNRQKGRDGAAVGDGALAGARAAGGPEKAHKATCE